MLIDLQLHSRYSDGYLQPTEIVDFIAAQGVKVAALTDHNTVGGVDEFRQACRRKKIKAINGLELYVKLHRYRFNLLWYNFNEDDPNLHNLLRKSHIRRRQKMRKILEKLYLHGFKINVNKILDRYSRYVPVNHVADALMESKHNLQLIKKETKLENPREGDVLNEYFYNARYGHLKNAYIDMDDILSLREKIGGQLVLCHPAKHGFVGRDFIEDLKYVGLDGLELLSPHHPYDSIMYLQHLAGEAGLFTTGGSDFHRFEGGWAAIQNAWQYYRVDSELLREVDKVIGA